ncbi:MAG TPA: A/G-specific adenine glycosylase [Dehalococcoidia bacterium]|nr:A/G-specific adenine glycosylase [Dehalococcoidia bacterium]
MLHQTQVQRVEEVYQEFLERFPTVDDVAAASLEEVKAVTDPLGYKRRGGYIKQIADEVVEYGAGEFPRTVEGLMELPGVGRYTAGAIMTFAHESPTPILDTNVARVLSRCFAGTFPPEERDGRRTKRLWALAAAVVPTSGRARESGWAVNQALMDLGAQLCPARRPRCEDCPMRRRCHYAREDAGIAEATIVTWREETYPRRKKSTRRKAQR